MTGDEYRAKREELGYNQTELGAALGLARETITRRESGVLVITPEAQYALSGLPKKLKRKK